MKFHSKRYRKSSEKVDRNKKYDLGEAIDILHSFSSAKFDEGIEILVKLGIDPKQSSQQIRGAFSMPNGIGKEKKVVVFAEGKKAEDAREAGAMEVGSSDLALKIQGGWMDFDVAIATPDMMRHVGKLGKVLGPQGKMPSVKSGTVTEDIASTVRDFRAGKVEYRVDDGANIHAIVGKKSFTKDKLKQNIEAFLDHIKASRPSAAKGIFIQKVCLSTTMGPGVQITA